MIQLIFHICLICFAACMAGIAALATVHIIRGERRIKAAAKNYPKAGPVKGKSFNHLFK